MTEPVRIRVLSYNVHGLCGDVAALRCLVREAAPDVMVVQEAPRRFRWRTKCAGLAHELGMVVASDGPGLGNLLLTTYRVRVAEQWSTQYPLTPGRHLRGAVFALCEVGRHRFTLAGSHLATHPVERPDQAARLKESLRAASAPVIVGLDLNDTPDGQSWRTVSEGLTDVLAAGDGAVPTYPAAQPRVRIDAIFADPRFAVVSSTVVDTMRSRRASDHLPVLAELVLTGG
jgi:endonuclease/exonuclease/phosphatase family metal-dependent hydrolase